MPTETINYLPLDLTQQPPGCQVKRTDQPSIMTALGANDRWLNTSYTPCLFNCTIGTNVASTSSTVIGASTNAASGSPTTLARFIIMGNAARRPVTVSVWALVNNGGTTGTLTVTYGGGSTTQAVTATSATQFNIAVTPTTGTAPLELAITGHTDDSNYVVLVAALGRYSQTDRTSGGAGADGYIPFGDLAGSIAESSVATSAPVSTELVARGWNNMRALARDRVACLATLQRPQYSYTGRMTWNTNSTDGEIVGLIAVPKRTENVERTMRLSVYTIASGTAAGKIHLGGILNGAITVSTTGGWTHLTFTMPTTPSQGTSSYIQWGTVTFTARVTSGSGFVNLLAAQVFREV